MAWNEPGGSGKKDPWGNRGGDQSPPDLDDIVKKLQEKFGGLFGGGGGKDGASGAGGASIGLIVLVVLVIWLAYDMIHIIQPAERGVVLRFGKYVATLQSGPNIRLPWPIETVTKVDVDQIRNAEIGYRSGAGEQSGSIERESLMLTQDENIVDAKLAVQYKIKSASDYLFNVTNPDMTLRQATESALREVIGQGKMDFVLTEGRTEIAEHVHSRTQAILDNYKSGLLLTSVNLQDAQPPEQVQHAFADAVKAREDEQRLKNEAEAYANDVIPRARGAAAREIEEANAYKGQVIAKARGEANRFEQVLTEYQKAPAVTRERLYLDAVQSVLANTSKVLVDIRQGNNVLYLPLDRMLQGKTAVRPVEPAETTPLPAQESGAIGRTDQRVRDSLRGRGER